MSRQLVAQFDPELRARVRDARPLFYSEGPDAALDRPAHVRAASGLCWLGDDLAVVQDDTHFLALVHPDASVSAVALPAGPDGRRQFGSARKNKQHKLDLEACLACELDGAAALLAFGSGSTPVRERLLVYVPGRDEVRVLDAAPLYAQLRRESHFAGSELNVEGATLLDDATLRLFQRGNGAARGGLEPVDAWIDLDWEALARGLSSGQIVEVEASSATRVELGTLHDVRLTFTDAAPIPNTHDLVFLAAAEESPDTYRDGPVSGSVLGIIRDERVRWTPLDTGDVVVGKAEGIVMDPSQPGLAYVVADPDDPHRPAELLEVEITDATRRSTL